MRQCYINFLLGFRGFDSLYEKLCKDPEAECRRIKKVRQTLGTSLLSISWGGNPAEVLIDQNSKKGPQHEL
jgi:hypothetical protein